MNPWRYNLKFHITNELFSFSCNLFVYCSRPFNKFSIQAFKILKVQLFIFCARGWIESLVVIIFLSYELLDYLYELFRFFVLQFQ